jgi:hypothetical protein
LSKDRNRIVAECLEAVDCSRHGLPHPRLNGMLERTGKEMQRRAIRQVVKGGIMRPTVEHAELREIDMTFDRYYYGPGGARRSD